MRLIVNVSDESGRVIYAAGVNIADATDRLRSAREAVTQVAERIAVEDWLPAARAGDEMRAAPGDDGEVQL